MKTRSYLQRHRSNSSEGLTTRLQTRSFSDRQLDQPQAANPDFSHIDLFSHSPQRHPIQSRLPTGGSGSQYEQQAAIATEQMLSIPNSETQHPVRKEAATEKEGSVQANHELTHGVQQIGTISRSPMEVVQRDFLGDLRATFAKITAVSRHIRQQNRIANIIAQGLAIVPDPARGTRDRDNLLHNSCEWIQQGQCQLFVLTPIHDSTTRDPTQGIAYFDPLVAYPNVGGDYPTANTVITSPHIQYGGSDDLGGLQPGGTRLEITNPQQQTDAQIKETLIHEVQHDADQTWPGQVWAVSGGASYNDYQSEFRSYWIENSEGSVNDHFGSSRRAARNDRIVSFTDPLGTEHRFRTRFSNRRQEKIFWHLVDAGYDYVPRLYTTDRAFRRMVNAFTMPVGGNLVNSVRIQAVSQALTACNTGSLRASAEVTALFTTASQLDAIDRRMLSSRRSRPFWRQARTSLSSSVYLAFKRAVVSGS